MKTVFSAAAVLALAGAASAAPFTVNGVTFGGDGTSVAGLTASTSFKTGSAYGNLQNQFVAGSGIAWNNFRNSGVVPEMSFAGAFGGLAPADWSTITPPNTPGGTTTNSAYVFIDSSFNPVQPTSISGFGWLRLGLGGVASQNVLGPAGQGEYVWLGQLRVEGTGTVGGDITVLVPEVGIEAWEVNGPSNGGLFLFTDLAGTVGGDNVYNLYITDVPAPGAMALLGVAGLAATRRRR